MLSSTQSARSVEAQRLRDLRGLARSGLIAAWVVFWLNTALFPCCEVTAAILGGHADSALQSPSAGQPSHHSDSASSEQPAPSPEAPCADALSADPPLAGEDGVRVPESSSMEWFAMDAPAATHFTWTHRAESFALARASPPPSLHPHLRTQRLLI